MFAFGIAPSAMNGSAASGLSAIRANPSASSIASIGHWNTIDASVFIWSREHRRPRPSPRRGPVTANWLAYVPEKPACEFQ